jgi:hypothetical protein
VNRKVLAFHFHPGISYGEGEVRPKPFIVQNYGDVTVEQLELLTGELQKRGAVFGTGAKIARDTP